MHTYFLSLLLAPINLNRKKLYDAQGIHFLAEKERLTELILK